MARTWLFATACAVLLGLCVVGRVPAAPVPLSSDASLSTIARHESLELLDAPIDGESLIEADHADVASLAPATTPNESVSLALAERQPDPQFSSVPPDPVSAVAMADNKVPAADLSDPLQQLNRRLYRVDDAVNRTLGRGTRIFNKMGASSRPLVDAVRNAVQNLQEPTTFANEILQRKVGRAAKTLLRFVVNSTVGVLGLRDAGQRVGLKRVENDFGQTLAAYGVRPGPYLYIPLSGPTTLRDAVGTFVDSYVYPVHWLSLGSRARQAIRGASYANRAATIASRANAWPTSAEARASRYAATRRQYAQDRSAQIAQNQDPPGRPSGQTMLARAGAKPLTRDAAWSAPDSLAACSPTSTARQETIRIDSRQGDPARAADPADRTSASCGPAVSQVLTAMQAGASAR